MPATWLLHSTAAGCHAVPLVVPSPTQGIQRTIEHIVIEAFILIVLPIPGEINSKGHVIPVDCQPPVVAHMGGSGRVAAAAQQSAIPSLLLRFDIGACIAGTSADTLTSTQCLPCEPRSFNFDGLLCAVCPFGASKHDWISIRSYAT